MWRIIIDLDKCTGCGECASSCPGEVYDMVAGRPVPNRQEDCHGCHTCESVCEPAAIVIEDK